MQGDHWEDYKGLSKKFLPCDEDQSYGTQGQAANCYLIEF